MRKLNEKVILVTGASRGIGAVLAKSLADEGAIVVVNYASNKDEAEKVVSEIISTGGRASAFQADVSKPTEVKGLFDFTIEKYGRINVLINNAGIMLTKPVQHNTDEEYDRQFDINVRGVFNALREASTKLVDNGVIINLSSSTTKMMLPGYGLYSATKAAVEQLTRVFSKEIGRGISVNSVAPGPTETDLFMIGKSPEAVDRLVALNAFKRLGQPEDIAKVIVFLASDDAKWISGQNIPVNGAMV